MKYHHLDEHLWFQSFADSRVSNAEIIAQLIAVNWGFRYFKLQILRTPRLWAAPMGVWRISIKELPQVSRGKNLIETATNKKTSQIYTNMTFFNHPSGLPEKSFALSDCWPKTCSVYHIQDAIQDAISLVLVFPWFFVTVVVFTVESWETKLRSLTVIPLFHLTAGTLVHVHVLVIHIVLITNCVITHHKIQKQGNQNTSGRRWLGSKEGVCIPK